MKRAHVFFGSLLCLGLVAVAAAQTTPDFSGRWTVEADPAAGRGRSGEMGSGWGSPLTITQNATRLTVEYAFFTRGDMQPPLKFIYSLDGSLTTNTVMMGRGMQAQKSKTAWSGESLVITTTHTFDDPQTGKPATIEVTQTLTLASPTSLVVETKRAGALGGPPTSSKTTYRKQ